MDKLTEYILLKEGPGFSKYVAKNKCEDKCLKLLKRNPLDTKTFSYAFWTSFIMPLLAPVTGPIAGYVGHKAEQKTKEGALTYYCASLCKISELKKLAANEKNPVNKKKYLDSIKTEKKKIEQFKNTIQNHIKMFDSGKKYIQTALDKIQKQKWE